jgi:hypothetical protein
VLCFGCSLGVILYKVIGNVYAFIRVSSRLIYIVQSTVYIYLGVM